MAQKLFEESYIASIAEAIREKNGTTNKYTVAQMADAIRALSTGGGGGDEPEEPKTIEFTIDGKEYTVDKGTTWVYWADWLQNDGYTTEGTHVVETEQGREVTTANGDKVLANSVIESGDYYCRTQPQGDTITFSLEDGDTFQDDGLRRTKQYYSVDKGTTWGEWVETQSGRYFIDEENQVIFDADYTPVSIDGTYQTTVLPSEEIEERDYIMAM